MTEESASTHTDERKHQRRQLILIIQTLRDQGLPLCLDCGALPCKCRPRKCSDCGSLPCKCTSHALQVMHEIRRQSFFFSGDLT